MVKMSSRDALLQAYLRDMFWSYVQGLDYTIARINAENLYRGGK